MPIVSTNIPNNIDAGLKLLLAIGLQKSKNEVIRDEIRKLLNKYQYELLSPLAIRERLDRTLGDTNLSELVTTLREEEMH